MTLPHLVSPKALITFHYVPVKFPESHLAGISKTNWGPPPQGVNPNTCLKYKVKRMIPHFQPRWSQLGDTRIMYCV